MSVKDVGGGGYASSGQGSATPAGYASSGQGGTIHAGYGGVSVGVGGGVGAAPGQPVFTSDGSFVVPAGVTSIRAVCVGHSTNTPDV
jgi:hypothetical protein